MGRAPRGGRTLASLRHSRSVRRPASRLLDDGLRRGHRGSPRGQAGARRGALGRGPPLRARLPASALTLRAAQYFAFFKYTPKVANPRPDKVEDFHSVCTETYAGWYHDEDKTHWGCFVARKVDAGKPASQREGFEETGVTLSPAAPAAPAPAEGALSPGPGDAAEARAAAVWAREQEDEGVWMNDMEFIQLVNEDEDRTWSARAHPEFEGRPVSEMKRLLGAQQFSKPASARAQPVPAAEAEARFKELPKSLDWRQVDGGRYATPVISQGSCGSCYAIAALDAATMRLRIATKGRDTTELSPMSAMACSAYNQGCDGGYPFLVGKHGEDIGFVPARCQQYNLADEMTCSRECLQDRVYRVHNYHYIGGYYGACNELDMMKELLKGATPAHGPPRAARPPSPPPSAPPRRPDRGCPERAARPVLLRWRCVRVQGH